MVGGGTGGSAIANKFASSLGKGNVAVLEPNPVHYYQPMFTLVGVGIKKYEQTMTDLDKVLPKSCDWIRDKAATFDPDNNTVTTEGGDTITYDYLVVAMGIQTNYDQIQGLEEALKNDPRVCSNYNPTYVQKTLPAVQNFKKGNAIFTFPNTPIKCAGAPQKICYLTEDYFTRHNKRDSATVIYNTSLPVIFGIPKYAESLWKIIKERNIQVNLQHNLVEVKPDKGEAVFELLGTEDKKRKTFKYDMLHVAPPCSAPAALWNSKLSDASGFVDTNKGSLQHAKYPNVFALGDCANLPTAKTAAAIAGQSGIVGKNLRRVMKGEQALQLYDGYTSCPLTVTHNRCILAEFGYDGEILETFPFNQAKPRRSMYHMKADVMPPLYWHMLVKGMWHGPKVVRKLLHLGLSK